MHRGAPTGTTTDTIVANDTSTNGNTAFTVDLTGGSFQGGTVFEPPPAEIEIQAHMAGGPGDSVRVTGGSGNDTWRLGAFGGGVGVNLNAASETVSGFDVDDFSFDGAELINLEPGDGNDSVTASGGTGFTGQVGNATNEFMGPGNDTFVGGGNVDNIDGGSGNDHLDGAGFDDRFSEEGVTDDDVLIGNGGNNDIVDYGPFPEAPVRVDLRLTGPQDTDGGGVDTLSGIEDLQGGSDDDVLIGNDASNTIGGEEGTDLIMGLGGALDILNGDDEPNTVSYEDPPAGATQGVHVDLAVTTDQNTGGAGIDRLAEFANVIGSPFADTLLGTVDPNQFSIRDGQHDNVTCRGGADTVFADVQGTDTIASDCETKQFDFRPDTSIASRPPSLSGDATPAFSFRSTKTGSTFQCSVDAAAFKACRSGQALAQVADGAHSFKVRAVDMLGATDLSPATAAFSVDTTLPRITKARIAKRFRLGRKKTAVTARLTKGSSFRYTLSEDATVKIKIERCTKRRGKTGCRRYKTVRTLTRKGHEGKNRNKFTGRIKGRKARRGLFRATLRATDEVGNRSKRKRLKFRIVRR